MYSMNYHKCHSCKKEHNKRSYELRVNICRECSTQIFEQVVKLRVENQKLKMALSNLLKSQDCEWENRNEGHDYAEACESARMILSETRTCVT